jgi:hypothetical protein
MNNGSTAVLWLRGGGKYHVWDSANTAWAIQTAAYTVYEQTVQPQATQVFEFTRSAIYANLNAASATVTGTAASTSPTTGALTVAGGVGIGGTLNVGGNAIVTDDINLGGSVYANRNLYAGGNLYASGLFIASKNKYLSKRDVRMGELYNQLVSLGYTKTNLGDIYIPCKGSYLFSADKVKWEGILVQWIQMRDNDCLMYGFIVADSGSDGKTLSPALTNFADKPGGVSYIRFDILLQ